MWIRASLGLAAWVLVLLMGSDFSWADEAPLRQTPEWAAAAQPDTTTPADAISPLERLRSRSAEERWRQRYQEEREREAVDLQTQERIPSPLASPGESTPLEEPPSSLPATPWQQRANWSAPVSPAPRLTDDRPAWARPHADPGTDREASRPKDPFEPMDPALWRSSAPGSERQSGESTGQDVSPAPVTANAHREHPAHDEQTLPVDREVVPPPMAHPTHLSGIRSSHEEPGIGFRPVRPFADPRWVDIPELDEVSDALSTSSRSAPAFSLPAVQAEGNTEPVRVAQSEIPSPVLTGPASPDHDVILPAETALPATETRLPFPGDVASLPTLTHHDVRLPVPADETNPGNSLAESTPWDRGLIAPGGVVALQPSSVPAPAPVPAGRVTPSSFLTQLKPITEIVPHFRPQPIAGERDLPPSSVERNFIPSDFQWAAPNLYYNPLYFEDPALERYGHTHHPVLQPAISVGRFGAQFLALPYQMALHPVWNEETPLGWYRPGELAPYLFYQVPFNLRAATTAAGTYTGLIFLFP